MKMFITGGCGFIGSNFILNRFKNGKHKILNYDKLTYAGNINNLKTIENNKSYSFIRGDICDYDLLLNTINTFSPDIIIHFAAESHVDRSISNPTNFLKTNISGTANLLNASLNYLSNTKNKDFKFIHVSTDEVFGSIDNNLYFDENSTYKPNSPYSASKASSDHLVRAWNKTYGLPTIITNCSNNYGPYQFPEKLIPLIISNCLDEKKLPIYGDGSNIRDWIYVKDHCEALNRIIYKGIIGQTYMVGGSSETSNLNMVKNICIILDKLKPRPSKESYKKLISFVDDRLGHDHRYAVNSDKIKTTLNWEPKESLGSGIRKTIEWYINNEAWWRKLQNPKF